VIWISRLLALAVLLVFHLDAARAQFLGTNFITGDAGGAWVNGESATAIGINSRATGFFTTAVGNQAVAGFMGTTAMGYSATATEAGATAIGAAAQASGVSSVAISGVATGIGAVGIRGNAAGLGSLAALGTSTGDQAIAVGYQAQAANYGSTSLGANSSADGERATAMGFQAHVAGSRASAFGADSTATGENTIAIGGWASATHENAVAFGSHATTTRPNQMMLGTSSNSYTAPGITSVESRSYQQGPTQLITTDSQGNLAAGDFESLGLASSVAVERNSEGVSMAMALSGVADILPAGTNYAVSTNWGYFESESALALGGSARLVDNVFINGGGAISTSSGVGGGRAGFTFAW
jgi:hypothetical protein